MEEKAEQVEALEIIQEKIDDIINEILSKIISDSETFSCSEFMKLLEDFLESIENETDDWQDMVTRIANAEVGSCSTEDVKALENIRETSEVQSQKFEEEIAIIAEKIEELEIILASMPTSTIPIQTTFTGRRFGRAYNIFEIQLEIRLETLLWQIDVTLIE